MIDSKLPTRLRDLLLRFQMNAPATESSCWSQMAAKDLPVPTFMRCSEKWETLTCSTGSTKSRSMCQGWWSFGSTTVLPARSAALFGDEHVTTMHWLSEFFRWVKARIPSNRRFLNACSALIPARAEEPKNSEERLY